MTHLGVWAAKEPESGPCGMTLILECGDLSPHRAKSSSPARHGGADKPNIRLRFKEQADHPASGMS